MDAEEKPHFTFIWTIENFSIPCRVESPTFTVTEMDMTKWHLEMDCGISGPACLNFVRDAKDDGPESVEIKCELSFLGIKGLPLIGDEISGQLENDTYLEYHFFDDAQASFLRNKAVILPKDTLTIRCRIRRTGTQISEPDLCFAHTLLRADRRIFVWAIREFSTLQRNQVRKFLLNPTSAYKIILYFFISEYDEKEYVNIDIRDSVLDEIQSIEICLLDFEGKVVHSKETVKHDSTGTLFNTFFERKRLMDDKMSLLPNDVLSLRFKIEMYAESISSRIENYRYLNTTNLEVITTDAGEILGCEEDAAISYSFTEAMKCLLEEGISSDVSLQTGDQSFPAHKNILSARSAVFRAMFNGDMIEKSSKCVSIPDITAETMRKLLSYIYTDTVGELQWKVAADLYKAADKYELLDLKERCSNFLDSALSLSNFSAIFTVADMHQDQELQKRVHEFLARQNAEFYSSDTWQSFREENPVLAFEILERMVCNMKRENGKSLRMF